MHPLLVDVLDYLDIGHRDKTLRNHLVERCRELDIAGATVYRGIEGYGASTMIRKTHLFSSDSPILIQVIDTEENIRRLTRSRAGG